MLVIKDASVLHEGLSPEMHFALGVAAVVYQTLGDCDCVVTSLLDGQHNPGSLHPAGKAADLRTKSLGQPQRQAIFASLKRYLEPMGFDVVFEGRVGATAVTTGAHIHLEYQPKPGERFWQVGA